VRGIERVRLHADSTILAKLACALSRARVVPLAAKLRTVANRLLDLTMECPQCNRRWDEIVEIKDDPATWPETEHGKDSVTCPHCAHSRPTAAFVGYADDVCRVPGANPDFP